MRLLALVKSEASVRRYLAALGEPTDPPPRAPARAPPLHRGPAVRLRPADLAAHPATSVAAATDADLFG